MDIQGFQGMQPSYSASEARDGEIKGKLNKLRGTEGMLGIEDAKLKSACQEFESFFIYMMMKEMRKTVPETKLIHGGRAEEIFQDMMDEEMSKDMAKSPAGGIGIADMMYKQLNKKGLL